MYFHVFPISHWLQCLISVVWWLMQHFPKMTLHTFHSSRTPAFNSPFAVTCLCFGDVSSWICGLVMQVTRWAKKTCWQNPLTRSNRPFWGPEVLQLVVQLSKVFNFGSWKPIVSLCEGAPAQASLVFLRQDGCKLPRRLGKLDGCCRAVEELVQPCKSIRKTPKKGFWRQFLWDTEVLAYHLLLLTKVGWGKAAW